MVPLVSGLSCLPKKQYLYLQHAHKWLSRCSGPIQPSSEEANLPEQASQLDQLSELLIPVRNSASIYKAESNKRRYPTNFWFPNMCMYKCICACTHICTHIHVNTYTHYRKMHFKKFKATVKSKHRCTIYCKAWWKYIEKNNHSLNRNSVILERLYPLFLVYLSSFLGRNRKKKTQNMLKVSEHHLIKVFWHHNSSL